MKKKQPKKAIEDTIQKDIQPLNEMTIDEIKKAYEYQRNIGWTFNHEFEKTDATLHNRFNFLLLAYPLLLNAYFMVESNIDKNTILIIGFIITFFLSFGIFRVYARYNILLKIINDIDDKEAVYIITKKLNSKRIYRLFPSSVISGVIIPIIMLLSFIIGIIYNILCG